MACFCREALPYPSHDLIVKSCCNMFFGVFYTPLPLPTIQAAASGNFKRGSLRLAMLHRPTRLAHGQRQLSEPMLSGCPYSFNYQAVPSVNSRKSPVSEPVHGGSLAR